MNKLMYVWRGGLRLIATGSVVPQDVERHPAVDMYRRAGRKLPTADTRLERIAQPSAGTYRFRPADLQK